MIRVLVLGGVLAMPIAGAAAPPAQMTLVYDLAKNGLTLGEVTDRIERSGDRYRIESVAKATGLLSLLARGTIRRTSEGRITKAGLRPREFRDERTGRDSMSAVFDWDARTLLLEAKGQRSSHPLEPGTQDRLSFAYGFAFGAVPASEVSVGMTDGRKVTEYHMRPAGREEIETPLGRVETLHLVRVRYDGGRRSAEMWLSPVHHYLPAKVRIIEPDGSHLDQVLRAVSYGGQ